MNDMSATIVAKSDQINAADLIGTTRTITIKEVRIKAGEDQPVSIMIEGDKKAFRPCKGVRRLLTRVWGLDANKYIGQSMTLFQDPSVTWSAKEVGGIRISHMTGLDEPIVEMMRTSRTALKPYKIEPLAKPQTAPDPARKWADAYIGAVELSETPEALNAFADSKATKLAELESKRPDLHAECLHALDNRRSALAIEGKPADQMGEDFAGDFDGGEG